MQSKQYTVDVSVVMAVYNGEAYLREAIQSIVNQTYSNLECIIVNDASTDKTQSIIAEYQQQHAMIRSIVLDKNVGLSTALNIGISHATGRFIVRMDADDISVPDRVEKQVAYMQKHPQVMLCGTQGSYIDTNGASIGAKHVPTDYDTIKQRLIWNNQIIHSSWCVRKKVFDTYQYDPNFIKSQDYDLLLRLIVTNIIVNLPDRLIHWRVHQDSMSWSGKKQELFAIRARMSALLRGDYAWYRVLPIIAVRYVWLLVPQSIKKKRYDR